MAAGDSGKRVRGKFLRRRLLPFVAWSFAVLGLLVAAQFVIGRVATDRSYVTQYIWWIPAAFSLLTAWFLLVVSWLAGWASLRTKGVMLRPVLLLACLVLTGWLTVGEWKLHRYITGGGSAEPSDRSLRVLHWNLSANKIRENGYWSSMLDTQSDIVLLANTRWGSDQRTVLRSLAPMAPAEEWFEAAPRYNLLGQPGHFFITHRGMIASRFPIVRAGVVSAGPLVNNDNETRPSGEHGWVIFAEFDRRSPGALEPDLFVVWLVDLPSDPETWRMDSMREMRGVIQAWDGRAFLPEDDGWGRVLSDGGFPTPDLVIGDFNALRGSASVDVLAPGYQDAFDAAGRGFGRSWLPSTKNKLLRQPIKLTNWQIDLAMVAPDWRTVGYELVNPGRGPHWVQIVDLAVQD
ncbi:MAG: hypothetical protein AB8F26_01100 [Phycisphaerales bacterium]